MKRILLAVLALAMVPAMASAGDRWRDDRDARSSDRGYRYEQNSRSDRGYRYSDRSARSYSSRSYHEYSYSRPRSSIGFSFGYSSGHRYGNSTDLSFGYSRGYGYRPPVVVRESYVYRSPTVIVDDCPPVIVRPAPRVYYYDDCAPQTYTGARIYYYDR